MILIDESKLTYGTLSMIGQDYNVQDFTWFDLESYANKVIKVLKEEEREYYNNTIEIENIINALIEDDRKEEAVDILKDLLVYISRGMELKNETKK